MITIKKGIKGLLSKPEPPSDEARKPLQIKRNRLFWGFRNIPFELATRHFMVMGSTGSGKTTVIRLLLKSVIPNIGKGICARAFIYDNKREYISYIKAMQPKANVRIVNPFDARSQAWDISADVTHARHANSIATILIPHEKSAHQPFFTDAARAILSAVMCAFAAMREVDGLPWSLRDVIVALRSVKRIRSVVSNFPAIEEMVAAYLNDPEVMPSILSTIATKMAPFEVVAALWEKAKTKNGTFSLSSWLDSKEIIILSSSPANRASITPIIQVLFTRLCDLLLDAPNTEDSLTWLFLDEAREAGKLEGLSSLLNQGRSKGVPVVLGFQEIEGMIDVYGENVANEICGQCGYKTFLRTGSAKSAKWVEFYWGNYRYIEANPSSSVSYAPNNDVTSTSETVGHTTKDATAILGSELQSFPPTGPKSGVLAAMHDIPGRKLIKRTENWPEIEKLWKQDAAILRKNLPENANEVKWPPGTLHEELVKPWEGPELLRIPTVKGLIDAKKKQDSQTGQPGAASQSVTATESAPNASGSVNVSPTESDTAQGSDVPAAQRKRTQKPTLK